MDVDKLKAVSVESNKLSDALNNEVLKGTVYNKLPAESKYYWY